MIQQSLVSGLTMAVDQPWTWYWPPRHGNAGGRGAQPAIAPDGAVSEHPCLQTSVRVHLGFRVPISRNYFLFFGVLAAQGCTCSPCIAANAEGVGELTDHRPQWATMLALAAMVLGVMELFKLLRGRLVKRADTQEIES